MTPGVPHPAPRPSARLRSIALSPAAARTRGRLADTRRMRPAGAGGRARDSIGAPPSPATKRAARGLRTRSLAHVPRMRHAARMPKMIQVRSVPDRLHRELVRRARKRGRTVTSYIQEILEREVSRPLAEEVFEQIARATPVDLGRPAADFIREERVARGRS